MKEISVRGSFVGSRNDLEADVSHGGAEGIFLDTEEAPLDAVNDVFRADSRRHNKQSDTAEAVGRAFLGGKMCVYQHHL